MYRNASLSERKGILAFIALVALAVAVSSGTGFTGLLVSDGQGYVKCPERWASLGDSEYECEQTGVKESCYKISRSGLRCYPGKVVYREPEFCDFAERVEGNIMIRHVGGSEYEVWRRETAFDSSELEKRIEEFDYMLSVLEEEQCPEDRHFLECMEDRQNQIEDILHYKAEAEIKLGMIR